MPIAGAESNTGMDIGLAFNTAKYYRNPGRIWKDLSTQELTGSCLIINKKTNKQTNKQTDLKTEQNLALCFDLLLKVWHT